MKKFFPNPRLSVHMLIIWLVVQMSVSPGQILLGTVLAVALPLYTHKFWPDSPRVHNLPAFLRYLSVFLWDVLVANLEVAWQILMPQDRLKPRFVFVPLDVQHPFTITVLASTISLTPGTVSSHISGDRKMLIVHCLHSTDDAQVVRQIKERYEAPLKEIFE